MALRDIGPSSLNFGQLMSQLILNRSNMDKMLRLNLFESFRERMLKEEDERSDRARAKTQQQQEMALSAGSILASAIFPPAAPAIMGAKALAGSGQAGPFSGLQSSGGNFLDPLQALFNKSAIDPKFG